MQDQAISRLASRLEQFMMRFGYEKIETPIIQPAELFLTKAGDQIIHRLFTFERLGRQLALRPEFTATAARAYITQFPAEEQPVVRWQFGGSIFEEGSGDSQRYSIGAELIGQPSTGDAGAAAEAEIIALAASGAAADADEASPRWTLVIGHAQLMRVLLERFRLDSRTQRFLLHHLPYLRQTGKAFVLDQLDQLLLGSGGQDEAGAEAVSELSTQQMLDVLLDATQRGVTMGGRTRHDIVRRLLEKRQRATERGQVVAALDFLEAWSAISAGPETAFSQIERLFTPDDAEARRVLNEWRTVIALLDAYGIPASQIRIEPALARSWDYYTGIVFELWSENGYHVGGGGRYDELARLVGGERNVPAVGFAYYVDQLLAALPPAAPQVQQPIRITAASYPDAIRWAQALRQRGQIVILQDNTDADAYVAHSDGSLRRADHIYTTADELLAGLEGTPA
ncbi:MAG: ATP phosphoribosyltransferase regulatory subunit [Anaerolineae bacterium]